MKSPLNKAQIRRLSDRRLEQFLQSKERAYVRDTLYFLAIDEQLNREEQSSPRMKFA